MAKLLPEPVRSRGKSLVLFSKLFRGILVRLVMDDVMYQLEKVARLLLVKTCASFSSEEAGLSYSTGLALSFSGYSD